MTAQGETFTIGIEEEYQIIDPATRELRPQQSEVLLEARRALGHDVQPELQLSQVEAASPVCASLAEVRSTLVRMRRAVIDAARSRGLCIGAAGTHPLARWEGQQITPKERYQDIHDVYRQLAREQVIFGCHVHIGLTDREMAIAVMNRARSWLGPLLALGANSPFWGGIDSGYASFRAELWWRWPTAGPPDLFESRAEHDALIRSLVATGVVEDETKIYWDIRLPARIATIEFRVTDVCLTIDDAVMIGGLVRALVHRCYEAERGGEPYTRARPELVRAAHWRAARYGLEGELVDVAAQRTVPAAQLVNDLLEFVRPALDATNDWEEISTLVRHTLAHGNGAQRQCQVYAERGSLESVVDFIIKETASGVRRSEE
jgi:carboxylate-amine ligase